MKFVDLKSDEPNTQFINLEHVATVARFGPNSFQFRLSNGETIYGNSTDPEAFIHFLLSQSSLTP